MEILINLCWSDVSDLVQSLNKLTASIDNLEAAIDLIEESANVGEDGQHDMFASQTRQAIAQRLDKAIEQVETALNGAA